MKNRIFVLLFLGVFPLVAFSQNSDAGVFLPTLGGLTGLSAPHSGALFSYADPRLSPWNPAIQGDRSTPLYSIALGSAFSSTQGNGVGAYYDLGAAIPTPFAVLWTSTDGSYSPATLNGWGAAGGFSLATGFSKRLYDSVTIGAGIGAGYLGTETSPWAASVSLGTMIDLENFLPWSGTLGLSLLGLGSSPPSLSGPTPVALWELPLYRGEKFGLSLSTVVAFPRFSDLALGFGASFALGRAISLDLGWNGVASRFSSWSPLPSLSIRWEDPSTLRLGPYGAKGGFTFRNVQTGVMATEANLGLSTGEKDVLGPQITLGPLDRDGYSPRLIDQVTLPVNIHDGSPIRRWSLSVMGPQGAEVYRQEKDIQEKQGASFISRLLWVERGLPLPSTLRIPLDPSFSDGLYRIRVSAVDRYGNEGSAERTFTVDGTPPWAIAKLGGPNVFSPNGDGLNDFLRIHQEGSTEKLWEGIFMDPQGTIVARQTWKDSGPGDFDWDGKSSTGTILGDGTYTYSLRCTDEGGNRFESPPLSIRVDGAPTTVSLALNTPLLSTDPDSPYKTIDLRILWARKRSLESWTISITGLDGKTFRTWKGIMANLDPIPDTLGFDGRNEQGEPIPDGTYRFQGEFRYSNGDTPRSISPPFTVDSSIPSGTLRCSSNLLVLDSQRELTFYHDLSPQTRWTSKIVDSQGKTVKTFILDPVTDPTVTWQGLGDTGVPLPEGTYTYLAEGINEVGLRGRTESLSIRVEKGGYDVALFAEKPIFSVLDPAARLRFYPQVQRKDRVVSYALDIKNTVSQALLRHFEGIAPVPGLVFWDGRDDFGVPVPDGTYQAVLSVRFEGSPPAVSAPAAFRMLSTAPRLSLEVSSPLFSPNGKSPLDRVFFSIKTNDPALWRGTIVDDQGGIARSYEWKGLPPPRLVWDGSDGSQALFPNGSYRFRLEGTDEAGNKTVVLSPPVLLDARVPSASIATDKVAFSPNQDGFADTMTVKTALAFSDGLASWRLFIVPTPSTPGTPAPSAQGPIVRTLAMAGDQENSTISMESVGPPPATVLWDGKGDDGSPAPDGTYRAVLELRYRKGDRLRVESSSFILDTRAPDVQLTVGPLPFSPDGDGYNDVLYFKFQAQDASPLGAWLLTITDPQGYPFMSFSGKDLPSGPLAWDGRNQNGDLVEAAQDYGYTLRIRDAVGNTALRQGRIPTDVFVLRDGDRLKIRISSIVFPPSSADLGGGSPEIGAKNQAILDRIAAVLARYPQYRIRVEGHGVNVSGTEWEEKNELEGLSLARAKAVLEALVSRGVDRNRLEARGLGGREPLVPHGDLQARWRNRRVEFILMR